MRIRFSFHGLRGVRVLELDCQGPNSDLPPPKGMFPVSRLGDPGENGKDDGHNMFERCDDKIETLGMTMLEFGDKCGNLLSIEKKNGDENNSISNNHPYALTNMWPQDW